MTTKLLVLDRDGLLIEASKDPTSPIYYILRPEDVKLKKDVQETIYKLRDFDGPVVVWTKQRGIHKGLCSRETVDEINSHIERLLNYKFTQFYVEPKSRSKVGILSQIFNDYPDIHPSEILAVDDEDVNVSVAGIFGCQTLLTDNLADVLSILGNE